MVLPKQIWLKGITEAGNTIFWLFCPNINDTIRLVCPKIIKPALHAWGVYPAVKAGQ